MADPFSIAGSAVGVISLGLQVCSLLVAYCQSVKDADQDIESVLNKAAGLRVPLKTLRDILEEYEIADPETSPWTVGSAAQSDIREDMKDKVQTIVAAVERLKASVDKYKPPVSHGGPDGRFRASYKKLVYHFRKDTLRDMIRDLDEIQMNLHTSLHVYSVKHLSLIPYMIELQKKNSTEIQRMSPSLTSKATPGAESDMRLCDHQVHQSSMQQSQQSRRRFATNSHLMTIVKAYTISCPRLGLLVSASLLLNRGNGGWTIAPTLRFYTVSVRKDPMPDNVLWSLLYKHLRNDMSVDRLILEFRKSFSTGEASPADMLSSGRSLLHGVCMNTHYFWSQGKFEHSIAKFIRFLVESGTPVDTITREGQTALDILCSEMRVTTGIDGLVWFLIDCGAVFFPEIVKTILRESESDLKAALGSNLVDANCTIQSLTLLELTVGWPKGLQILLDAGADIRRYDTGARDPIYQAIRLQCEDSLRILLQAGCTVRLSHISFGGPPKMLLNIVQELASRRKRLWELSESYLPRQYLARHNTAKCVLPDTGAAGLYDGLRARNIALDPTLRVEHSGKSVHHGFYDPQRKLWVQPFLFTTSAMYKAGFRDIDVPDSSGRTPLMTTISDCPNLDTIIPAGHGHDITCKIRWFVSKGANLFRMLPRSSATTFHYLACAMFYNKINLCLAGHGWGRLDRYILRVPIADNCLCGCCLDGCTPLSMALRLVLRRSIPLPFQAPKALEFLISHEETLPGSARPIIRSMTFDALGLTHTCCRHLNENHLFVIEDRDLGEVQEIREEEKAFLERFECLVEELNSQFYDLGLPLLSFLQEYWHPRIMDFLAQRDLHDEEHVVGASQLGVQLSLDDSAVPDRVSLKIGVKAWEVWEKDEESTVENS
ncbi:hypothetical protein BJX64DRAFT_283835 [Aspergillus heterothallicus]